ncbi:hypothetical protein Hanom_Chr12g01131281 [Helianthus anomalus]
MISRNHGVPFFLHQSLSLVLHYSVSKSSSRNTKYVVDFYSPLDLFINHPLNQETWWV